MDNSIIDDPYFYDGIEIANPDKLYTWCIYDTPEWYVAARFEAKRDGTTKRLDTMIRHKDINALREIFRARGLYNICRQPDDAPNIIETWL